MRHSSGTTPLLVVATLAAAAADGHCHALLPHSPRAERLDGGGGEGGTEEERGVAGEAAGGVSGARRAAARAILFLCLVVAFGSTAATCACVSSRGV